MIRWVARLLLGAFLIYAGKLHLTTARRAFLALVPNWVPFDGDFVVVWSGIVEIILGLSLIVLNKYQAIVGWIVAAFFVAVFPGNIAQYTNRTDAFGLNTDTARAIRLLFQPLLVLWAMRSTGAWRAWMAMRSAHPNQIDGHNHTT